PAPSVLTKQAQNCWRKCARRLENLWLARETDVEVCKMNYPGLRSGHTLIEALIVITILALLAALIYSNMGPMQEKGRRIVCISNLSQLNHAISLYRSDYDGEEASSTPALCGFPPSAWALLPYARYEEGIFHCPSVIKSRISQLVDPRTGRWTLYGMN